LCRDFSAKIQKKSKKVGEGVRVANYTMDRGQRGSPTWDAANYIYGLRANGNGNGYGYGYGYGYGNGITDNIGNIGNGPLPLLIQLPCASYW
jgi:hypothetical protein